MFSDCILIIRSVYERTEELCRYLILEQGFPESQVEVIHEMPFSAALRKSFERGIESGKKWTFCIDADVLPRPGSLLELINRGEEQPENICQIQSLILDKFIPVIRPAGYHLYRTSLLEKALRLIPEEGSSLRPETDMLNEMSKKGYPWVQCDVFAGIHDFEQYYEDIYRKCFLQAHKHKYLIPLLEPYWVEKSHEDTDFIVAMMALRSGKVYGEKVFVDKHFLRAEAIDVLAIKHIKEKDYAAGHISVSEIIERNQKNEFLVKNQEKIFPTRAFNNTYDLKTPLPQQTSSKSTLGRIMYKLSYGMGSAIENAGRRLKNAIKN